MCKQTVSDARHYAVPVQRQQRSGAICRDRRLHTAAESHRAPAAAMTTTWTRPSDASAANSARLRLAGSIHGLLRCPSLRPVRISTCCRSNRTCANRHKLSAVYDDTRGTFSVKGCLYYDTCTTYMCAAHVRRTCAMTVYAEHARCFQHV